MFHPETQNCPSTNDVILPKYHTIDLYIYIYIYTYIHIYIYTNTYETAYIYIYIYIYIHTYHIQIIYHDFRTMFCWSSTPPFSIVAPQPPQQMQHLLPVSTLSPGAHGGIETHHLRAANRQVIGPGCFFRSNYRYLCIYIYVYIYNMYV